MNPVRILAIGDVVRTVSTDALCRNLWALRRELHCDLAVVNGENAAQDNGLDAATADRLLRSGTDVITSGNHIWKKQEIYSYIAREGRLLRPANYPAEAPGSGYTIADARGYRVLVINVLGTVFMDPLDCPFATVEKILKREDGQYDLAVLDVHAEATSEKAALARYFDGKIAVIFGTHTHVQTADARVLPNGTGFITDLGMTGPEDSILGIRSDAVIEKLRTKLPRRFEAGSGPVQMTGAIFTCDTDTGKCVSVEPVARQLN